ncbi:hypothetical protein EHS13_26875 [Paenibacillus psychroresistens]|uniref:SLH domain-containing protein n=1 Tax=Paenibacillus psychroresistens TaxID=1778678 RepID=A0A6B8RQX5_9BACL|nr:hypothetical protein [Paenibacillus psychroresistens]QGQ98247.1 hypothetical protein EHS13_26875 [Paenibacillus psychroresistens]
MTRLQASSTKLIAALLLTLIFVFTQTVAHAAQPNALISQEDSAAEYKQYIKEKFNVSFNGASTKGQFIEAVATILSYKPSGKDIAFTDLKADNKLFPAAASLYENGILGGPGVQAEQPLSSIVAVSIAVRAAGLKELAYTYPTDKVALVLKSINQKNNNLAIKTAQELAAAADAGLIPAELLSTFQPNKAADAQLINTLLGKILVTKGLYKHYIGYVNDADIFAKLSNAFVTSDIIHAPKLQLLVNTALEQNLITGYSLKDSRFNPNFISSLSLIYGHSDLNHAVQLIGLLRSEGLNAKVQFEPKTSAFIFLKEWGEPGPDVVQIANGNFISYAKEFDLEFEFSSKEQKAAFQGAILAYAKKNVKDQSGLIASSWFQPLYYSSTELKDYEVITNNYITDKDSTFTVNPFSLNEDSAKVVAGFKAIDPNAIVTPYQFWVDKPFFNYLHGEPL